MRASIRITRALMLGAFAGLVVLAVLGFQAQDRDLRGLRKSSQELIFWDVAQGEVELQRFIATLGRYLAGDATIDGAEVNKRFDIVWSRVTVFRQGEVGRRLAQFEDAQKVIDGLDRLLRRYERDITELRDASGVGAADREVFRRVMAEFARAAEDLRGLSVRVLQAEEARLATVRGHVRSSAKLTWMFSMAALALAALLVGILLIETRRYRRMAQEAAELAARAEAASEAKGRFLTMMSHELRTPMNGVLGLLALLRQSPLSEPQQRLVERAERSGRQMSALLSDILDFSDLHNEKLKIAREVFDLPALAHAVEEVFGPIVQREGVKFQVEIGPDAPRWVVGDRERLRQAIGHFITFFVDMVGADRVILRVRRGRAGVVFEIEAASEAGIPRGWQPEAIFDRGFGRYGDFASDSLGPMIARGLLTLMSGTVELKRSTDGRAILQITVPLETIGESESCVRIEAQSVTVQAMLGALLRDLGVRIWSGTGASREVSAVLLEAGGDEEVARAARLRAEHPGARLIALGEPANRELFEAICPIPVTAEELARVLNHGSADAPEQAEGHLG